MDSTISSFFDDVFEDESTDDMWLPATETSTGNLNAQELPTAAGQLSPYFGSPLPAPPACDTIETGVESQSDDQTGGTHQLSSSPCIDLSWLEEDDDDVPYGRLSSVATAVAASPLPSSPSSSAASDIDQCGRVADGGGMVNVNTSGGASIASTSRATHCPPLPPIPGDEELARLSIPELEQRFRGAAFALVSMLKRRRRMILNRRYARTSRSKRACKDQSALCEVDELRNDRDRWKALAEALMRELESYKRLNKR